MRCITRATISSLVTAAWMVAGSVLAVPTIDGTVDAEYGSALSVQNTNTQFGNADTGDPINAGGGSEIDQVFGTIANGRLYVAVTGNLEWNFNKLEVFIDSDAENGGVNMIDGFELPDKVDGFCCGPNADGDGALQRMDRLVFDDGFQADYYLTFTNGREKVRPDLPEQLEFWATSVHFADLTQGTGGATAALGMQLAQRGLPNVLRGTTADFDVDGTVNGGEFLTWQRNVGLIGASRSDGDATGDSTVNGDDLGVWQAKYGFEVANAAFDQDYYIPNSPDVDNSDVLVGPGLPGLSQGELIDKNYALSSGGCNADNSGAGCLTRELEFALPVESINDSENTYSHRNFDNIIDLQMALDNSNVGGVSGDGPYEDPTTEDPSTVLTGIEFSIPLSQIGNPTEDIRITAFINGGGHDFSSNQYAGEGILRDNIGSFMPDLELEFDGDQFVTISQTPLVTTSVPEPSSLLLMLAITLAGSLRRCSRTRHLG